MDSLESHHMPSPPSFLVADVTNLQSDSVNPIDGLINPFAYCANVLRLRIFVQKFIKDDHF